MQSDVEAYTSAASKFIKSFEKGSDSSLKSISTLLEKFFKHSQRDFLQTFFTNKQSVDIDELFVRKCILRMFFIEDGLYDKAKEVISEQKFIHETGLHSRQQKEIPQSIHRYLLLRMRYCKNLSAQHSAQNVSGEARSIETNNLLSVARSLDHKGQLLTRISMASSEDDMQRFCDVCMTESRFLEASACTLVIARALSKFRNLFKAPVKYELVNDILTFVKLVFTCRRNSTGVIFPNKLKFFLLWCKTPGVLQYDTEAQSSEFTEKMGEFEKLMEVQEMQCQKALDLCQSLKDADNKSLKKAILRLSKESTVKEKGSTVFKRWADFGPYSHSIAATIRKRASLLTDKELQQMINARIDDAKVLSTELDDQVNDGSQMYFGIRKKRHRDEVATAET